MVTFFNRIEICNTCDIRRQEAIRNILSANGIDYSIKARMQRTRNGSFGINLDYAYQYRIYVKKEDYEKASYLIK